MKRGRPVQEVGAPFPDVGPKGPDAAPEEFDAEVHNPDGFTGPPLLAVDRVEAHVPVFAAVFGDVSGTVVCEHPVVTLQRTADGRTNWTGLGKEGGASGRRPALSATVERGLV